MYEICFCGWSGDLEDRVPVYAGDDEWALACPHCGHRDRAEWMPAAVRKVVFDAAFQRQARQHEVRVAHAA
jgi:hypothetical protein